MPNKINDNGNNIKVFLQNAGPNSKLLKEYKNSLVYLNEIQAPLAFGVVSEASIGLRMVITFLLMFHLLI